MAFTNGVTPCPTQFFHNFCLTTPWYTPFILQSCKECTEALRQEQIKLLKYHNWMVCRDNEEVCTWMRAQNGLPPYVVGTFYDLFPPSLLPFLLIDISSYHCLFCLQGPRAPLYRSEALWTRAAEEWGEKVTTHPEPTPMGGRRKEVVATKPCSITLQWNTMSTLHFVIKGEGLHSTALYWACFG